MKYFFLLLLLTTITACDDDDAVVTCAHTSQGDQITLADGTLARLAVISDARCPCEAACIWAGYLGLTITIGSDTILRGSDVFGGAFTTDTTFIQGLYHTSRGDRIRLLDYTEPENSCDGAVAGEDFCLELSVE